MRTESMSKAQLIKAQANKPKFDFVQSNAIKKILDGTIPGAPTAGKLLISVKDDEVKEESSSLLETNTSIHQVVSAMGMNDERIKEGAWIQVQKNCPMEELEWGSRRYLMVREMSVMWVFDRNPREEFNKIGDKLFSGTQAKNNAEVTPIQYVGGDA